MSNTVEPPVCDHSKCKTEWTLTEGVRYKNQTTWGSLPRRGPGTFTLWKIIILLHAMSKLGYV